MPRSCYLPVDGSRAENRRRRGGRSNPHRHQLRLDLRRAEVVLTQLTPDAALLSDLSQNAVRLGRAGQVSVVVQAEDDLAQALRREAL